MTKLIKINFILIVFFLLVAPVQIIQAQVTPCSDVDCPTAIGRIPTDPANFVNVLVRWIAGFSGGVSLLLMAKGAFQMITSAGDPDSIKSGRDQLIAATIGLLFIILSVSLLQIVGVDILKLPGLAVSSPAGP